MTHIPEQPKINTDQGDRMASNRDRLSSQMPVTAVPELGKPYLQVENIHKYYGQYTALKDIYLDVYPGEFICLLGPSGCGKTTLLRIICGLETQSMGRVIQDSKDISKLPPANRDFGIVFQSYALFPNLTATQNIAYGLQNAKESKATIDVRVSELLDLVGLSSFGGKYPAQMSGGQQQRVALARALALSPGLLLLDEPLSALDAQVRVRLRTEITQLQKRLGITTVMVTHDQAEALAMADRVVVMDKGYIAQIGTAHTIYERPSTPFVANFIGVMNFLSGEVVSSEQVRCGNAVFQTPNNELSVNQKVLLAIRPENIRVLKNEPVSSLPNVLRSEVEETEFLGSFYRVVLRPDGNAKESLTIEISTHEAYQLNLEPQAPLMLQLPPEFLQIFPA